MWTTRAFIKRYPVLTFYALVFAISWGGILILVGPGRIPGTTEGRGALDYRCGGRRGQPRAA